MIRGRFFWTALLGMVLVYTVGLFTRLMENDSAQFAVMAMRMFQEQDFLNLWKGGGRELDQPHPQLLLVCFFFHLFNNSRVN